MLKIKILLRDVEIDGLENSYKYCPTNCKGDVVLIFSEVKVLWSI